MGEIASSRDGRDITRGYVDPMMLLMPDDSVLMQRGGGDYALYREVLRDDRVKTGLQQRFHAVIARPWEVRPGGTKRIDKLAAEHLREQLDALAWDEKTAKMLYGVFYGHAVAEMMWGVKEGRIVISDIKARDRRRFGFDGENRLRLKTLANPQGELLPDKKFWAFATGTDHDDAPYGLGLAHWLYWPVWFKRNGLRFWAVFLEKFGTPTVAGTYPAGTLLPDQQKLLASLRAIQRDSAVIFQDGMKAELLEATRSGTADHAGFIGAMNEAITTLCVGQMASTSGTPGKLGNDENQNDVRLDLVKADADLVCASFNAGPARWLTEWNFPGAAVPQVWRTIEEPEDLKARAEREGIIFTWGYKPTLRHVQDTYGGEWTAPESASPLSPGGREAGREGANDLTALSEFAEGDPFADQTALDAAIAAIPADNLQAMSEATLAPILKLLDEAESFDQALTALAGRYPDMDATRLEDLLARAMFAAELTGRHEADQDAPNESASAAIRVEGMGS